MGETLQSLIRGGSGGSGVHVLVYNTHAYARVVSIRVRSVVTIAVIIDVLIARVQQVFRAVAPRELHARTHARHRDTKRSAQPELL